MKKLAVEIDSNWNTVKKDLDAACGISIYRDDFRVLPYGEPDNDWLKLDLRRVNSPTLRLSNNQLVGYISFSLDSNQKLKDQSNREGIIDSPEFSDVKSCIKEILNLVEKARRKERIQEKKVVEKEEMTLYKSFEIEPIRVITQNKVPDDKEIQDVITQTESNIQFGLKKNTRGLS